MPEPTVYWQGSYLVWQTGDGPIHVVWAMYPTEAMPVSALPKPKTKRGK